MHPTDYLQFAVALIFVLGLIGLTAVLLRRFGPGGQGTNRPRPGTARRLSLIETLPIDARHRLVIVRYDDSEAVVMLGAQSDTVIEKSIPAKPRDIAGPVGGGGAFDAMIRRIGTARSKSVGENGDDRKESAS
ncbi:FliO/MopB family protein [Pacificispira spongiicola]|uniref:FliO/MopB family protein n=1 Tax=Pacificispira spongiicola TaxID=2729598 RepID=UPI001D0CDC87|nr:flagellar biosynthetic protein FliO [Pacificispira spongiicola]